MELYTLGFTQKSAEQFFTPLREAGVGLLVDVRLNNVSQLAGFTKGRDLAFFLRELCGCDYVHCPEYAPSKELLDDYKKKGGISWDEYTARYVPLMEKRGAAAGFLRRFSGTERVCLLCSEAAPEKCHRRLLAELIQKEDASVTIKHL